MVSWGEQACRGPSGTCSRWAEAGFLSGQGKCTCEKKHEFRYVGCACTAEIAVCALKLFHDFWKYGLSFAWPAETSESRRLMPATLSVCDVLLVWIQYSSLLCPPSLDLEIGGGEMLMRVFTFWIWQSAPLFQSLLLCGNDMCGRKQTTICTKQKFYMVEVAIEYFFFNHCIAVTWVEHACKNFQLHTFLSCRKACCRID